MAARLPAGALARVVAATAIVLVTGAARGQPLPWEITVAATEAGRIRQLAEQLNKENLLFQLRLGQMRKADLLTTAGHIDRILASLEQGAPGYAIPSPWTPVLSTQLARVDTAWGSLRKVAVASPYEYLRARWQFVPPQDRAGDPLLLRYFDALSQDLVTESEKLLAAYDAECRATGIEFCATARIVGYNAMLVERATKEAVFIVAGIDVPKNRKLLKATLEAYEAQMKSNDSDPTFIAALSPDRGQAAAAAAELLTSLRGDWELVRNEFAILSAGDEENFDLAQLLTIQNRLIDKIERFTAVIVRFANVTYGG